MLFQHTHTQKNSNQTVQVPFNLYCMDTNIMELKGNRYGLVTNILQNIFFVLDHYAGE